jgi:hypothetical protein
MLGQLISGPESLSLSFEKEAIMSKRIGKSLVVAARRW